MKRIVNLLITAIILLPLSLMAENRLCISGDNVRLRSGPSLSSSIKKILYHNDKFLQSEVASNNQNISGLEEKWYKLYTGCEGMECASFSPSDLQNVKRVAGYVFGSFLSDCNKTNEILREKLLDESKPLNERLLFRNMIFSEISLSERFLPKGVSTKNTNNIYYIDVISSQFTWKIEGKLLKINYNAELKEPGSNNIQKINLKCVYKSIIETKQNYYKLESIENNNKSCNVLIY